MSLRVAYRREVCLVASGLFEIVSKSAVWIEGRAHVGRAIFKSHLWNEFMFEKSFPVWDYLV